MDIRREIEAVYGAGYLANELGKELKDDEPMLRATVDTVVEKLAALLEEDKPLSYEEMKDGIERATGTDFYTRGNSGD